jgi:hypothetical protein
MKESIRKLNELVEQLIELQELRDKLERAEPAPRPTAHSGANDPLKVEYENPRVSFPSATLQ